MTLLGWGPLFLGLPVALCGVLAHPNEYEAALGINALDCDGPAGVYLVAIPALTLYAAGLFINGLRWRKRLNFSVAVICFAICAGLLPNIARAVAEDRQQAEGCASL